MASCDVIGIVTIVLRIEVLMKSSKMEMGCKYVSIYAVHIMLHYLFMWNDL